MLYLTALPEELRRLRDALRLVHRPARRAVLVRSFPPNLLWYMVT